MLGFLRFLRKISQLSLNIPHTSCASRSMSLESRRDIVCCDPRYFRRWQNQRNGCLLGFYRQSGVAIVFQSSTAESIHFPQNSICQHLVSFFSSNAATRISISLSKMRFSIHESMTDPAWPVIFICGNSALFSGVFPGLNDISDKKLTSYNLFITIGVNDIVL